MSEKVTLELTMEHARTVMNACELLMRMRLGQTSYPTELMLGWPTHEEMDMKEFCLRRDLANKALDCYLHAVLGTNRAGFPNGVKDELENMSYEVWGTIRYALWKHEHPDGSDSWSVASREPMSESGLPMPKCSVVKG